MSNYEDYDMISDTLGWLGMGTMYKFVTRLNSKDKDGNRNHFHKEFTYNSSFINVNISNSISRSFDYYITIENKPEDIYIQIRPHNMIMLQNILSQVTSFLFDTKIWAARDKKLIIKGKPEPITLYGLPMDKWIMFELITILDIHDQYNKGVRITLGDTNKYTDVSIDSFMGFVYLINTIDMYQCAVGLLNYIRRPPLGTNMISFLNDDNTNTNNTVNEGISNSVNRTFQPKQNKSFFSRVDSL